MPGVGAALVADHHVGPLGQHVDQLALPLVAPLGARPRPGRWSRPRTCRLSPRSTKRAPRGAPESSGKRMRAHRKGQFAARARPTASASSNERPSGRSAGVWITTGGAPGEATQRHRAGAGAREWQAVHQDADRQPPAADPRPETPQAGLQPRGELGAARVVRHDVEISLLVEGVEVEDFRPRHRAPESGREDAGAHHPELLRSRDAHPRRPIQTGFGEGQGREHSAAVVPRPGRRAVQASPPRQHTCRDDEQQTRPAPATMGSVPPAGPARGRSASWPRAPQPRRRPAARPCSASGPWYRDGQRPSER